MIDNIVDQIKRDEGLRLIPYKDSQGHMTAGYGHNLDAHPADVARIVNGTITEEQAAAWLTQDVIDTNLVLNAHLSWIWDVDVARRGVLQNMCFNMGWGGAGKGLSSFHIFLNNFMDEKWDAASAAMLNSLWAKQVGDRADRLAEQIRVGVWQ